MSKENPVWKKYYWIDMYKLCLNYTDSSHKIHRINYFTAPPLNEGKRSRQDAFLRANKILNQTTFNVINGKYTLKDIRCNECSKTFQVPEEKITDVNIATQIMKDCYINDADRIVLISADSDLLPPLDFLINDVKGIKVKLIFPPKRFSSDLFNFMVSKRQKVSMMDRSESYFLKSMMPDEVKGVSNTLIRPENWK